MATETTNYKFKKPDTTDFYNIADQNGNWEECDKQLKLLDDGKAAMTHEHTKAEITDLPTRLPADGGNADTVGGIGKDGFIRNLGVISSQNVLTFVDTIETHQYSVFRMFNGTGVPTNYGYVDGDNDFWYTVSSIDKGKFVEIAARDVRSNSTFYNVKLNGIWQGWSATNATTLGGKSADRFVQRDQYGGMVAEFTGAVENNQGGRLYYQKPVTTSLTAPIQTDVYDNSYRIIATANGDMDARVAALHLNCLPKGTSQIATYRAGTTDITAGVTNIGQFQMYIVYE